MAEAVALAIEYAGAAIGTEMTLTAGEIYLASQAIVATAAVYTLRENQRRQQNAARDTYNASLRDRYLMTRGATEPRQVVLGRQRVSGPLAYIGSYGTNREHLVFAVILAAHEIDAVEAIYFDDERVTLDGSGNMLSVTRRDLFTLTGASASFTLSSEPAAGTIVATVAYGTTQVTLGATVSGSVVTVTGGTVGATGTVTLAYQPAQSPWTRTEEYTDDQTLITLDASGNGTATLAHTPEAGSVRVVYSVGTGVQQSDTDLSAAMTVSGSVVTVTGAAIPNVTAYVSYRWNASFSKARVRKYLGAAGQAADAGMVTALPGIWTSAHTLTGLAYLVVELDYDPDAFPSGLPNVSALVRGAKLYDPRTSTTAWSENPALMMRYVATSPLLGRQTTATVNDASVIVAANACDTAAAYVVNGRTYNRALYTAGLAVKSGTRAKDVLDDLARAMAGRWVFIDGQLRVKAGAYVTPLQTLDESWLAGGQAVQVQARANRSDVFNVATGKFADETRDYIIADYPRVAAAAYITEDGAELPLDVTLNTVTFTGQAQQVAAVAMRDARQGLRVSLLCNMRAFPVEVFDTLYVTLPRFGWSAKAFEVLDVAWTLDGGIQLALKETDATIWALGSSFADTDPAPNTLLPSPWKVPPVTGLTCTSGTSQLLKQSDGTIISRIRVSWNAITDAFVTDGGGVEVRYGFAWQTEDQWQSVDAPNGQAALVLDSSVRDGLIYLVKARAYNALVRGAWCAPVLHKVVGKSSPPADVASFGYTASEAGVEFAWTAATDVDYDSTVIKLGATWATATTLFDGAASKWTWVRPASGSYTVLAKHRDTSGNESTNAVSLSIAYTSAGISNASVSLTSAGALVGGGGGQVQLPSLPGLLTPSQLELELGKSIALIPPSSAGLAAHDLNLTSLAAAVAQLSLSANVTANALSGAGIFTDPASGTVRISAVEQTAAALNSVAVTVNAHTAAINLRATTSYVDQQIAAAVLTGGTVVFTALDTRLTTAEATISGLTASVALKADSTTVNSQGARLTTAETNISGLTGTVSTKANSSTVTALDTRVTTAETNISALGSQASAVTDLQAGAYRLANNASAADASTLAALLAVWQSTQTLNTALALAHEELTAKVNGDVSAEAVARLLLAARVAGAEAAIVTEQLTRATADSATASQVSTLQARLNTGDIATSLAAVSTSASATASAVTGLNAQLALKVQTTRSDGKLVLAGIGLASTSTGTTSQSEIILAADALTFVPSSNPNAATAPLLTTGTVNGVTKLIITSAVIGDLTVGTLALADGAATDVFSAVTNAGPVNLSSLG